MAGGRVCLILSSSSDIKRKFYFLEPQVINWAGSQPFSSAHAFNTSLSDFLFQNVEKGLDQAELQSILNTNQRFLLWMKAIFPVEFQNIRLNWIVKISEISNGKEVII